MFAAIFALSFLAFGSVDSRECDCAQFELVSANELPPGESAEWINNLLKSFYEMNSDKLLQKIGSIIDEEVNPKLPSPMKSIELKYLNLTDTPGIDLVSHHVTTVGCEDGGLYKRYTVDFDLSLDSPGLLARARAAFALGLAATVSVEDVKFSGVMRVEVLMSSDLILPSIQYVKVMFINQPKIDFEIELYDIIGLDTFGIKDFIKSKIDEVLQQQLVYPGMVYADLSRGTGKPQVSVLTNDKRLHPAILSANITMIPVNTTYLKDSVEAWLEYGDDEVKRVKFPASTNPVSHQFDVFISDLQHTGVEISIVDVGTFVDDTWFDVVFNIAKDIRYGSTLRTFKMRHKGKKGIWDFEMDVFSFLLPSVQMSPVTSSLAPSLIPSLYSLTDSSHCAEHGVLYISLHGGFNLTASDGGHDPYVKIFLDGEQIGKTATATTAFPTYDFIHEALLRSRDGALSDHVIELRAWDHDTWSKDDLIGSAKLPIQNMVGENVYLTEKEEEGGAAGLVVTVLFRPVVFF